MVADSVIQLHGFWLFWLPVGYKFPDAWVALPARFLAGYQASTAWTSACDGGWQPARVQLMAAACMGCAALAAAWLPENRQSEVNNGKSVSSES